MKYAQLLALSVWTRERLDREAYERLDRVLGDGGAYSYAYTFKREDPTKPYLEPEVTP